jgi:hypothetical protein
MRNEMSVEDEKMEEQQMHQIVPNTEGYTLGHSLEKVYEDVMRDIQYGKF